MVVSAVDLHFYKVPTTGAFLLVEEYESSLGELSISELGSPLHAARKLESIFVPQPQENYLHLIVTIDAPLRITCWVQGADVPLQILNLELQKHAFPLELSSRVKELLPALADVALSDLKPYTLSTKNDDELKDALDCKRKGGLRVVSSGQMMKDAFDDLPFSSLWFKAVIEVVSHQTRVPPSSRCLVGEGDTVLRARQKFLRDYAAEKPSTAAFPSSFNRWQTNATQAIPCGRPRDCEDHIPTTLLHQFIEDIERIRVTAEDDRLVLADIRDRANVMVCKRKSSKEFMIVDFEWGGDSE